MRMLLYAGIMAAFGFSFSSDAIGTPLDDFKGYSIEIRYTTIPVIVPGRFNGSATHTIRLYFSLTGNIFFYSEESGGMISRRGSHVETLGQAMTMRNGRMRVWTVEEGHLTGIFQLREGFFVSTIAVDPSHLTCTFSGRIEPDPVTGRVVIESLSGNVDLIMSYTVSSYTCTVKPGNIFAPDQ
jgi:hypothetical protein